MKLKTNPKKLLSFLLCLLLVLPAASLPGFAEPAANQAELYFFMNFDGMDPTLDYSGKYTDDTPIFKLFSNIRPAVRFEKNLALLNEKKQGTATNPDHCIFPFRALKIEKFSEMQGEAVLEWDLFVSSPDGGKFNLFAGRGPSKKWNRTAYVHEGDGKEGLIDYGFLENGEVVNKTSEISYTYGQWNRVSAVLHHPTVEGSNDASYDLYINGTPVYMGAHMWGDTDRFTVGKFMTKSNAPQDCCVMIDNVKFYSGNQLRSDKELGIPTAATAYAGVQDAVTADACHVRFVATVDALSHQNVGFTVRASYMENGQPKTKEFDVKASCVYKSIIANTDLGIKDYTASELGGTYLYALTVSNIPVSLGTVAFEVSTFVTDNGIRTQESLTEITYRDGSYVSAVCR